MKDEVKELLSQLESTKKDIVEIRKNLNQLDKQKEGHFSKRSSIQEKISAKIKIIKDLKNKRNKQTDQVKELKGERDILNKEIGGEVSKLKDVKVEPQKFEGGKRPETFGMIKMKIRKLEEELETSAMKFEREKRLNKELKLLKKKADKFKAEYEKGSSMRELSKDIRSKRTRADAVHKQIQDHAKQSQEHHEELLKLSKEIDELKEQEKVETEEFNKYKTEFVGINTNLKSKLEEINKIKEELDKHNVKIKEDRAKSDREFLKQKDAEVQEKLKKKKKLTTEDILILQSVEGQK